MTKPATPKGTELNENEFRYGVNEQGDMVVNGVVVEKAGELIPDPPPPEEPEEGVSAEVEGAEATPSPPPQPKEEPPPEPVQPQVSERQKFKLKVQGEEIEREYTPQELIARLQMAEDYQKKTMQLAEERRKIEPFMPIIEKPEFKQWIGEQVEAGVLEAPRTAPPPSPEDIIGFRMRQQEPEFVEIQTAMTEWAATIPAYEAEILNTNPRAFNDAYDRFKATKKALAEKATPPPAPRPPEPPKPDPKVMEQILQAKKVASEQARVETPGGTPPEVDPKKEWRKVDQMLRKAVKDGTRVVKYQGKWVDPDMAWAQHRYFTPE